MLRSFAAVEDERVAVERDGERRDVAIARRRRRAGAEEDDADLIHRSPSPSPGLRPPSPRSRGARGNAPRECGPDIPVWPDKNVWPTHVALLPECGEKVREARMRGAHDDNDTAARPACSTSRSPRRISSCGWAK